MAAQINGVAIPSTMNNRGRYQFTPPRIAARNGQGEAVTVGGSTVEWVFPWMTSTEFAWWYTTILAGNASRLCTNNRLWNALNVETAYSSCVVLRPEWSAVAAGGYRDVTIRIEDIFP